MHGGTGERDSHYNLFFFFCCCRMYIAAALQKILCNGTIISTVIKKFHNQFQRMLVESVAVQLLENESHNSLCEYMHVF